MSEDNQQTEEYWHVLPRGPWHKRGQFEGSRNQVWGACGAWVWEREAKRISERPSLISEDWCPMCLQRIYMQE